MNAVCETGDVLAVSLPCSPITREEPGSDGDAAIAFCLQVVAQAYVAFFVPEARQVPGGYNAPCAVCNAGTLHISTKAGKTAIACTRGCAEEGIVLTHIERAGFDALKGFRDYVERSQRTEPDPQQPSATTGGGREVEKAGNAWPSALSSAALHGFIGDMVRTISPHTEADSAALVFQFLAAFGNCIGRKAFFQVEADRHFTNLFTCIVGRSAKGRKGTSWGHIRRLFAEVDHFWTEDRIRAGLSSGEGLIFALRDDGDSDDKRLLAVESEFATVLRVIEREGNTVSARLRDAWDSGKLYTLTKNSPLKATGAHISIIGHCTVEELRRYLTRTELGNGFANRFLWVCAQRSKLLPDGGNLSESEFSVLIDCLRDILEFTTEVQEVQRDDNARQLWREVYPYLSRETPGMLGSIISRAEAQVTRLSLLYALLDKSRVIRPVHLKAALGIWEYSEQSSQYIFGNTLGDSVADRLLILLKSAPDGTDKEGIHRHFKNNLPAQRIDAALNLLAESGLAQRIETPSESRKGRPAEIWRLIPSQHLPLSVRTNEENETDQSPLPGERSLDSLDSYFVTGERETEGEGVDCPVTHYQQAEDKARAVEREGRTLVLPPVPRDRKLSYEEYCRDYLPAILQESWRHGAE